MTRRLSWGLVVLAGFATCGTLASAKPFNLDKAHVPGQLIVKFKSGFEGHSALVDEVGATSLHTFKSSGAQLIAFDQGFAEADLKSMAESLAADPRVQYVEANTILHITDTTPNDPRFSSLYGLKNTGKNGGIAGADIHATQAWDVSTGSRDVVIGIIDTGVDYNHPDIKPNLWTNPGESGLDAAGKDKSSNGIDDDHNGFVDDWHGWNFVNDTNNASDDNEHGTHVAGTIGANGNDGVGVVGVNWKVSMVPLKFLDASGSGSLADATRAIDYASTLGLTLTSNSWGGGGFSETMKAAIEGNLKNGVLFIAAAGNDGVDNDSSPHYPASYDLDNVISVAATDNRDSLASFSCYGKTTVHLGAPGVNIISSIPGGGYAALSGTSMATPHVSGAAALIKAVFPEATAADIKARLVNSVDAVAALEDKTISGGRLNIANAISKDTAPPGTVSDLQATPLGMTSVRLTANPALEAASGSPAARYEVRYAATPITDEASWNRASRVSAKVSLSEVLAFSADLSGLGLNSSGFVAVKAISRIGRVGAISASAPFHVQPAVQVYVNDAESLHGVNAQTPWGLEQDLTRQKNIFSLSPGARYPNDLNTALTLPEAEVHAGQAMLTFDSWSDLERVYDVGHVEVSVDHGTIWTEVDSVTGQTPWTAKTIDLTPLLHGANSVLVRFRATSDGSISGSGWRLDHVVFYAPAAPSN